MFSHEPQHLSGNSRPPAAPTASAAALAAGKTVSLVQVDPADRVVALGESPDAIARFMCKRKDGTLDADAIQTAADGNLRRLDAGRSVQVLDYFITDAGLT
jgi:hypothetical protein